MESEAWDALIAAASAYADFVAARDAMNAVRPVVSATPAEYALYDERYKVDHAAERKHFRTAIRLAQMAEQIVESQVKDTRATPPAPDVGDLVERLRATRGERRYLLPNNPDIKLARSVVEQVLVNPDGLEAADLIERLAGVDHG